MKDTNDILRLKKWEAQEAVGFLHFLEKASLEQNYKADFDAIDITFKNTSTLMERDKFYRLVELDRNKQRNSEKHKKLYLQLIDLAKPDLTIHKTNISLIDGIKYKLYIINSDHQST